MSLSLREKLKLSIIEKEARTIIKNISNKLQIDGKLLTFESRDYNAFLSKTIDDIDYQPQDLSINENRLFSRFCDFVNLIKTNDLVYFQIITLNDYYYLKLPINYINQDPTLFWNLKVNNSNKMLECLLVAENNSFGFSILPSEYCYEFRRWFFRP